MRRPFSSLLCVGALVAGLAPLLSVSPAHAAPVLVAATGAPEIELGYDRLTLRRGDSWLLRPDLASGPATSYQDGASGWVPVAGDTNGDGSDSLSLFRQGVWLIRDSQDGPVTVLRFGLPGDLPVLGDWDGDGTDSVGVFRRGRWYLRDNSLTGPTRTFGYGLGSDLPVVGDWNGDGRTDIAVVRNRVWYQRDSASGGVGQREFAFGNVGDRRIAGDWDHDGRDSPGVFRDGTWYLRESSNPSAPYAKAFFGRGSDTPLVRRIPGLAPGVTHRVWRDGSGPFTAHVATVDLAAASSPDAVLASGQLATLESTSSMARRSGAVLAINGDYFLSNGRPVHAFAEDGRLVQTPQLLGRAFGLDSSGTRVTMGFPDARATLTLPTATGTATLEIPRWNSGRADADRLAAYTSLGGTLETPPGGDCYAGLNDAGPRTVHTDGGVDSPMTVSGQRCGGDPPYVSPGTVMLDGSRFNTSGNVLEAYARPGTAAQLTTSLGFPGAVDVLGGNPVLIYNGRLQSQDLQGSGAFFARQPRTALGITADGRMLLVVVDGRQSGYSVGMTLGELAELMNSLGARSAINLDGGGSSTMWLNGQRVNRPSDRYERGVGSALVVLPGADAGQDDLTVAPAAPGPPKLSRSTTGIPELPTSPPLVSPVVGGTPVAGWRQAALDPGSIGGLADALRRQGTPLPGDLARAEVVYQQR